MEATTITERSLEWLSFLLQTSDSVFPTGGYAHSFGLEEVVRMGVVRDERSLIDFLENHTLPALGHIDLPLAREAHRAALADDLETLLELDQIAGSLRLAREPREASLHIGRRRLAMLASIRPTRAIERLQSAIKTTPDRGHHAVVWGAACSNVPAWAALCAYYYQAAACQCMAAPKLIRIGQEAAQRALAVCLGRLRATVDLAMSVSLDEIGWFDPALDILCMRHEIAGERLFIS